MHAGSLPSQTLAKLIADNAIWANVLVPDERIQPASIDLSVGLRAYRVAGSFLPQAGETVADLLREYSLFSIDLEQPVVLERGAIYVVELNEHLKLPEGVHGYTNNKSSTGRVDLQARLLVDGTPRYDRIPAGYTGPMYLEIVSKSFMMEIAAGVVLNQLRLFQGDGILGDEQLAALYDSSQLIMDKEGNAIPREDAMLENGVLLTADLDQEIVGFRARNTRKVLSILRPKSNDAAEFFETIPRPSDGKLILPKDAFTILSSCEYIRVPPQYSVEMLPYDSASGEFRSHYAGFFDPGFGYGVEGEVRGTPAVLEVRVHDDDFILRNGQPICKMVYGTVSELPDRIYGVHDTVRSNYAAQRGPRLAKYFS